MVSSSYGKGRWLPRSLRPGEARGTQSTRSVAPRKARKKSRPAPPVGMTRSEKITQEHSQEWLCHGERESFVGEGFDRIDAGGAQGGNGGAEGCADESEADRGEYPAGGEENGEAGVRLLEDRFSEKGDGDAEEAAGDGEEGGFAEKHFDDVQAREAEGFEDADFAGAFENHGVHVHQDDEEADDDAEADHGFDEWFQFGKVGGVHERNVFGHGADAVLRIEFENFGAGGFGVAFAANEDHGDVIFGADNVLPGVQRNEEACAFAVGDNAGDSEGVINESDGVADFNVTGLGDDVVGERFVGSLEGASGAKDETLAEGVETFVINAIDDDKALRIGEDEGWSGFVDIGQFGDLVAEGFGHHSAGKGEKDRRVGRLDEKIGADAFDALAPLCNDAAGEADDHQNKHDLDGDGEDAERAAQRARGEIAPEHA